MLQTTDDLLGQCNDAIRTSADFPTVWQTTLGRSALVVGTPVQRMSGNRAQLQVRPCRRVQEPTDPLFDPDQG
jgi:hypothetical protein